MQLLENLIKVVNPLLVKSTYMYNIWPGFMGEWAVKSIHGVLGKIPCSKWSDTRNLTQQRGTKILAVGEKRKNLIYDILTLSKDFKWSKLPPFCCGLTKGDVPRWGDGIHLVNSHFSALIHCWWECKLIQPVWQIIWSFLKKLKIDLPYNPTIPLPGIHPKEIKTGFQQGMCTPMFTAASFTTSIWKQLKHPSINEWVKAMCSISTMK